jgi:hypothetical protein
MVLENDYVKSDCTCCLFQASEPASSLIVTNITSRTANITWTAPSKPNGQIVGYVAIATENATHCRSAVRIVCSDCSANITITLEQNQVRVLLLLEFYLCQRILNLALSNMVASLLLLKKSCRFVVNNGTGFLHQGWKAVGFYTHWLRR